MPKGWTPDSTFIRVDFPAPFSPQMLWISPRCTSKFTSDSARTPGNSLVMSRIAKMVSVTMSVLLDRERMPGGRGGGPVGAGAAASRCQAAAPGYVGQLFSWSAV